MKSFRGEKKREQGKTEACEFHLNDEEELSTNYTDYTDKKTIKHGQQTGVEARGNEYLIVPVPFYCPAACALNLCNRRNLWMALHSAESVEALGHSSLPASKHWGVAQCVRTGFCFAQFLHKIQKI